MVNWQQYSKAELRTFAVASYRQGGGSRPDVFLLEKAGEQAVLKDHAGMDPAFAKFVGPLLTWREAKALRRLTGVTGIPELLYCPDKRSLLMEHVNAKQVVNVAIEQYDAKEYFADLRTLIERIHVHGVAHGDLRSPTNALIDENGQAVLVDFVASFGKGSKLNIFNRFLFNKMCLVDISAITKLKKRIAPELLNETDIESEDVAGNIGMIMRSLGQSIRKLSRRILTKKL